MPTFAEKIKKNLIKFKEEIFCKNFYKVFLKYFIKGVPTMRYIYLNMQKCKVIN